jgi:leader peptidase (prepilin peptidase)/N-methyltransferase
MPAWFDLVAFVGPVYLMVASIPLTVYDIKQRRLPNKLVLPGFPISVAGQLVAAIAASNFWPLIWAFISASCVFCLALLANRGGAMGMGDVKLLTLIALSLGWWGVPSVLLALGTGFGVAATVVLGYFMVGRLKLTNTIPLGPYLLFGAGVATTALVWS